MQKGIPTQRDGYGTKTTDDLKDWGITLISDFLSHSPSLIPSREFWLEAKSFVKDPRGRIGAEGKRLNPGAKNYDDLIMAVAMAFIGTQFAPKPSRVYMEEKVPEWLPQEEVAEWQRKHSQVWSVASQLPEGVGVEAL